MGKPIWIDKSKIKHIAARNIFLNKLILIFTQEPEKHFKNTILKPNFLQFENVFILVCMYLFLGSLNFKSKKIRLEKKITDIQNRIQTQHTQNPQLIRTQRPPNLNPGRATNWQNYSWLMQSFLHNYSLLTKGKIRVKMMYILGILPWHI